MDETSSNGREREATVEIKIVHATNGTPAVRIELPNKSLIITPDLAARIALELLSTAYIARAEAAFNQANKDKGESSDS